MRSTQWDRRAASLLKAAGVTELPVDVTAVAHHLGIHVMPFNLGDDVSGVLVQDHGQATIGYNEHQHPVRQRFTIAHEIGHFIFHKRDAPLFVDHDFRISFRNKRSSTGKHRQEREANAFAAALLMPWHEVKKAAKEIHYDLMDDRSLTLLARKFDVSRQSMSYRLARVMSDEPAYPSTRMR